MLALAMLASACALPTDAPNWDMTWNIPIPDNNAMSIGVSSFLPSGVTAIGNPPTAFSATPASPPSISRALGADCAACVVVNGLTSPKPAFTAVPPPTTVNLASGLTSATLAAGSQVVFTINNGFNFDPIRPQAGSAVVGTGTVTLTVTNGAATLGTLSILGTATAIPAGAISSFTLPLVGTVSSASPLTVTMTMNSPAGTAVLINTTQVFSVSALPTVNISSASVTILAQAVNAPPTAVDMSKIDSTIINRIQNDATNRGTMFLTITNPFTIGGAMNITFSSPTGTPAAQVITPITKSVTLTAAANGTTPNVTTSSLNFTGIELRKILGHNLQAAFGGNTSAGLLTVTPSQKVGVTSRMQLNFTVREQ